MAMLSPQAMRSLQDQRENNAQQQAAIQHDLALRQMTIALDAAKFVLENRDLFRDAHDPETNAALSTNYPAVFTARNYVLKTLSFLDNLVAKQEAPAATAENDE